MKILDCRDVCEVLSRVLRGFGLSDSDRLDSLEELLGGG